jgi:protein-S-isoprenylcysteine O-methyltransferase Ste14
MWWREPLLMGDVAALALWLAYFGIRGWFEQRLATVQRRTVSNASDTLLLAAPLLGVLVLPLAYFATPWLARWNTEPSVAARGAGAVLMLVGLVLFWRAHADLGRHWSRHLTIWSDHELVTTGLYAVIRHPMYLAMLVIAAGQGLLLGNALAGWAGLAGIALLVTVRIPREEALMHAHFGSAYGAYAARTGCLLPRWHSPR